MTSGYNAYLCPQIIEMESEAMNSAYNIRPGMLTDIRNKKRDIERIAMDVIYLTYIVHTVL